MRIRCRNGWQKFRIQIIAHISNNIDLDVNFLFIGSIGLSMAKKHLNDVASYHYRYASHRNRLWESRDHEILKIYRNWNRRWRFRSMCGNDHNRQSIFILLRWLWREKSEAHVWFSHTRNSKQLASNCKHHLITHAGMLIRMHRINWRAFDIVGISISINKIKTVVSSRVYSLRLRVCARLRMLFLKSAAYAVCVLHSSSKVPCSQTVVGAVLSLFR